MTPSLFAYGHSLGILPWWLGAGDRPEQLGDPAQRFSAGPPDERPQLLGDPSLTAPRFEPRPGSVGSGLSGLGDAYAGMGGGFSLPPPAGGQQQQPGSVPHLNIGGLPPPAQAPRPMAMPPQQPPQAPQQQQPGSPLGPVGDVLSGVGDRALAGVQGFLNSGSPAQSLSNLLGGVLTGQRQDPAGVNQRNQQVMMQSLRAAGVDPRIIPAAMLNPEILKAVIPQAVPNYSHQAQDGVVYGWDPARGRPTQPAALPRTQTVSPGQQVVSAPVPGLPVLGQQPSPSGQPVRPGAVVASGGPQEAPAGFEWVDRNNPSAGMRAISGGPATQMSPDLAGRQGISRVFLEDVPTIRQAVQRGAVSGIIDFGQAYAGIGEPGQIYRKIQSGVDALRRGLTGAGMSNTEAGEYANRYLPRIQDTPAVVLDKVNQLERELRSIEGVATAGRTPNAPTTIPRRGAVQPGTYNWNPNQ